MYGSVNAFFLVASFYLNTSWFLEKCLNQRQSICHQMRVFRFLFKYAISCIFEMYNLISVNHSHVIIPAVHKRRGVAHLQIYKLDGDQRAPEGIRIYL
jgi:hypothetical protein